MALGIPDKKPTGKGTNLGVPYDNSVPPANLMGKKPAPKPSVPEFKGPPGWTPPPPVAPNVGPQLPQGGNGPIFPQDPAQPISWNGGYINPNEAPYGFDQSQPGQVEQLWGNNQALWFQDPRLDWVDKQIDQFQDPWKGEQTVSGIVDNIAKPGAGQDYWAGVQGSFNTMGAGLGNGYTGPNNSQLAFDMTKGMLPGSLQPQFDSYYDRMKDKVMSDVNSQAAARGSYGSNSALNNSIGAGLDIEAQRAKAATDFSLADSANQREWQGLLGNQARGADLTGLGIFGSKLQGAQFGLDKTRLGGDLAFKAEGMDFDKNKTQAELAFGLDDQKLERLGAGISTAFGSSDRHRQQLRDALSAAGQADDARNTRINTLYDQNTDFSNDVMNYMMTNYDKLLGMDKEAMEAEIEAMLAKTADERGWDQYTTERARRDVQDAIEIFQKSTEASKGKK
jgi:hypothetical protein